VDQHAAHERIIAENFKKNNNQICLQALVSPLVLNLDASILNQLEKKNLKDLINYEVCENKLIVLALPNFLNEKYLSLFLNSLINLEENQDIYVSLYDYIHEYGCHNAIKSGIPLTIEESQTLLEKLLEVECFAFCNHGRPTYISFSANKLDGYFSRTKFNK
jgi:DNA mismatch repair protein MutL